MKCAIFISLASLVLTSSAQSSNSCFNRCTSEYALTNQGVTNASIFCSSYLTYKSCSLSCVSGSNAPDREEIITTFQLLDQIGFNCQSVIVCYSSTCLSSYLQNLKLYGSSVGGVCRAFTSYETCMKNACGSNKAFQEAKKLLGCNSSGRVQFSLVAIIACIFLALKI